MDGIILVPFINLDGGHVVPWWYTLWLAIYLVVKKDGGTKSAMEEEGVKKQGRTRGDNISDRLTYII